MRSSDLSEPEVRVKLRDVYGLIRSAMEEEPKALTAKGAEIWLVPTYKPLSEWQPIAQRKLDDIEWVWDS